MKFVLHLDGHCAGDPVHNVAFIFYKILIFFNIIKIDVCTVCNRPYTKTVQLHVATNCNSNIIQFVIDLTLRPYN